MPSDADLARSISELKDEFRSGLSSLKRELAQEHDAALKKLKTATASVPKFKKKGNEKQFLLNSEVLEHVRSASTALQASSPQVEKALEELKEGEKKLSHRNKLILIADSSEEGWEVVNEYQRRDLADDSDDDKRIRQAEVRASQKRRRAQLAKKSSSLRPQKPSTPPVPSLPYVVSGYGTPVSPSYPAVSLPGSNFSNPFGAVNWPKAHRGSRVGSCFACGSFGHFRNQCPVLQAQFSVSQPGKRT